MRVVTLFLFLLMLSVLASSVPEESPSEQNSTDSELFQVLVRMIGSEIRSWAKPIENVDMEQMLELLESGIITFHKADWFVEKDDQGE